jgi:hypothetical protein
VAEELAEDQRAQITDAQVDQVVVLREQMELVEHLFQVAQLLLLVKVTLVEVTVLMLLLLTLRVVAEEQEQ